MFSELKNKYKRKQLENILNKGGTVPKVKSAFLKAYEAYQRSGRG